MVSLHCDFDRLICFVRMHFIMLFSELRLLFSLYFSVISMCVEHSQQEHAYDAFDGLRNFQKCQAKGQDVRGRVHGG